MIGRETALPIFAQRAAISRMRLIHHPQRKFTRPYFGLKVDPMTFKCCRICGKSAKYAADTLCAECRDSLHSAAVANCTEDEDEDRYCQNCGEPLDELDDPYYCDECLSDDSFQ